MSTSAVPGSFREDAEAVSALTRGLSVATARFLAIASSLKLTVVLFALAMFIVFVGSLAQSRRDVWLVMSEYFRTYIAWVQVSDFFPPSMFPGLANYDWERLAPFHRFPFPGGWLIGSLMLVNLVTAHLAKFRIRPRGMRLYAGLAVTGAGILLTAAVIITGNAQTGVESGNFALPPDRIWQTLLGVLGLAAAITLSQAALNTAQPVSARLVLAVVGMGLLGVFAYFLIGGEEARLNVSSMRILWQLLKGGACSLVLLLGCNLLFEKRGGIVLLHLGVALLMISELQVGVFGKENTLALTEGQTTGFLRDIREREVAIVQRQPDGRDKVVVVPESLLEEAAGAEAPERQVIRLESLPFDIAVRKFLRNSELRSPLPDDEGRTSDGLGSFAVAVELDPVTGMDDSSDQSAAHVDVLERGTGRVLSSLLLSQNVSEMRSVPIAEQVRVDGQEYQLYLRFQRNYRPYEVRLVDVSRTNYVGSATPRDYRSTIVISQPSRGTSEEFTLWMNNPLRYQGETFYQSGYNKLEDGTEATTLSVVRNTGWMLPYIACMIVSFGMFGQFWQTVSRYLRRLDNPARSADPGAMDAARDGQPASAASNVSPIWTTGLPVLVVLICVAWLAGRARPPQMTAAAMNTYSFAKVPIAWNGRAQPVDSFARTQLLLASHKSTFEGEFDRVELDGIREQLISSFRRFWPSVKADSLQEFSGSYEEWMDEMVRLTSSGREAVEERMRPLMARRMPAVRWFLDSAARPELARRHRVIKIDDDQVLSLLGLPKRAGLTYSLAEIQQNLGELEPINQRVGDLRSKQQDNSLTTLERRVGALFETVSRIDSMQNMFLVRESGDLLSAMVDSWRILRLLGDRPAVMGVPTGNSSEQRSWETVVASNALLQLSRHLQQAGVSTPEQVLNHLETRLPAEIVGTSLVSTYRLLQSMVTEGDGAAAGAAVDSGAVQARAAKSAEAMRDRDPFLARILEAIASAKSGTPPEDIVKELTPERVRSIAAERMSSDLFEVFRTLNTADNSDPRLLAIRRNLQQLAGGNEEALSLAMNQELARLVLADLQERAGHLLPGGENSATFQKNAESVTGILAAWKDGQTESFNQRVADYQQSLAADPVPHLDASVVAAEAWFNYYEPFYKAICLYLPIIVLSFLGWLFWGGVLRRISLSLMLLAFVVHTAALLLRMWISGRPPVTNLYSSSIFIGWAVVAAALAIELIAKRGIGNIMGASVGAATLTIAHYLARDEGDTLGVMQAVLDTTFWLATHVVCITLGYAATFLAGAIAIVYCVAANLSRRDAGQEQTLKPIGQLVYGVLCFALFFSLVGTVLGGLWADDSWGRFWGWDPKENGAMLIVLWNVIILHARWDRMVRDYGTAVMAMFGNIVTAWSWFGVNELKAGLHTYGFTEGRLLALLVFVGIQAALIAIAIIPAVMARTSRLGDVPRSPAAN